MAVCGLLRQLARKLLPGGREKTACGGSPPGAHMPGLLRASPEARMRPRVLRATPLYRLRHPLRPESRPPRNRNARAETVYVAGLGPVQHSGSREPGLSERLGAPLPTVPRARVAARARVHPVHERKAADAAGVALRRLQPIVDGTDVSAGSTAVRARGGSRSGVPALPLGLRLEPWDFRRPCGLPGLPIDPAPPARTRRRRCRQQRRCRAIREEAETVSASPASRSLERTKRVFQKLRSRPEPGHECPGYKSSAG